MAVYEIKYITSESGDKIPVRVRFDNSTIVKADGATVSGKISSVDSEKNSVYVTSRGDIVDNDPLLASNNTFSKNSIDQTIKHLITHNHAKLMEFEYHRLGIKRFDLKFSDFEEELRLTKKSESIYYPKRYTHYEFDDFIHTSRRRAYRNCDVFHEPVNMVEISNRSNIFHRNFLIFIDGRLCNTCEIYPLDDRVGFIIDVATEKKPHGITYKKYLDYKERDVDVTVFLVPNFLIGIMESNIPTITMFEGNIPLSRVAGFEKFLPRPTAPPVVFYNDTDDLSIGVQACETMKFEYREGDEISNLWINVHDLDPEVVKRRVTCIQFPYEMKTLDIAASEPCFEMTENKVPIPTINMLPMRYIEGDTPSYLLFDHNVEIHAFYPNIYAVGNVLDHVNQIPTMSLTQEATDLGITTEDNNRFIVPAGTSTTGIPLSIYNTPFELGKGIYTIHHCHIEYLDKDGVAHLFPSDTENSIEVVESVIRILDEPIHIKSIRFCGSVGEEEDALIRPVIEPGSKYHEDTSDMGTVVVNERVQLRIFYQDLDADVREYHNDVKEYNWYRSLYDDYVAKDVPLPLIKYNQEAFICEYEDFKFSMWVPNLFNYKIARLRGYMERYPNFIRTYINNANLPVEKYYIEMAGINLVERIRWNTHSEKLTGCTHLDFDEARLVFAMNRQFLFRGDYAFRLFLDGKFLAEYEYAIRSNLDFYYIYLKSDDVNPDSILEVERYRLYRELTITEFSEEKPTVVFRVDPPHVVQAREIYLADLKSDSYLSSDKYTLEYFDEFKEEMKPLDPKSCFVISGLDVHITLTDKDYYGRSIRYGVNQDAAMVSGKEYQASGDELMLTGTTVIYTKVDFYNTGNFDDRSYRVFNNGRLCLPIQYYVKSHGSYGAIDSVRTRCMIYKGDRFTVDHTPSVYRTVYYLQEIEESGYVDLDGRIPLPLSLKYYDIYLNGLRLNRTHIEIISPTKCYIKNVDSRKNFVIFERNHDDDTFFLTSFAYKEAGHSDAPLDTIMREIEEFKAWMDSIHSVVDDAEKDQLEGGVISDEALSGLYVFGDILWNHELNSNKYDQEMMEKIRYEFPNEIVDNIFRINSVDNAEIATIHKPINPNLYFENKFGGKPIQKGAYRYGIQEIYLGGRPEASTGE